MKKRTNLIDGFVPRRAGEELGDLRIVNDKKTSSLSTKFKPLQINAHKKIAELGKSDPSRAIDQSNNAVPFSVESIDFFTEPTKKLSRKEKKLLKKQNKKPKSVIGKIIRILILLIFLAILGVGGYMGYKFINAGGSIFQGGVLGILKNQPLLQDINGRSNFLILGTSEDDAGHDGANLTDSMLVLSIDQTKKDVYMFSVPRDLYVKYGEACFAGYSGKINSYFSCANQGDTAADEQDRLAKTQTLVGDIFGLNIQYGVHVNHTVIKQAVDAVGGVDVDIEGSNGAGGVLDRNFDWRCNFTCFLVKYENGVHHLDGEHALYLSMARGDIAPTYGLSRSNFDREINQQKILMALKEKAMSTGIITNLSAVTGLINALGDNLRTNIKTEEIRTLMSLASDVKSDNVHSISLISDGESVVTTGNYGDASVVMPSAGIFEYDQIREFIKNNLVNGPIYNEAAPIVVLNGSGQAGLGKTEADKLSNAAFNVVLVGNAPDEGYTDKVKIYQIGDGNETTAKALSDMFSVVIDKTTPPMAVNGNVRFVIVFGTNSI